MKQIIFKSAGIGNEVISMINKVIVENNSLELINLSDNNFDLAGIIILNQNMRFNLTLKQIIFSSNLLRSEFNNKIILDKRIKF
jgi:hypothetical protein